MLKFHLVKNFRKSASWREKLFGHFLLIAGDIRIIPRKNLLARREYSAIAGKLQSGDLVFAGSKREISRFFLRGDLSHALIYLGKKKFIHAAAKHGVAEISLKELFGKYDFLAAYRHSRLTTEKKQLLIEFLRKSQGKAYDFRFLEANEQEFYCTKLVELAYCAADIQIAHKAEDYILPYVSTTHPEDLLLHEFDEVFISQSLKKLRTTRAKRWPMRIAAAVAQFFVAWGNI